MSSLSQNQKVPSVLNPYKGTAFEYRKAGFGGPLPLPFKEKHPPPVDFTKRVSPYPTIEEIQEWCDDGKRHNICIRLAGVTDEHELIGIDVDNYRKGDRDKKGFGQLLALEEKLGPLPDTWISSARIDGKSGIRWFRVPRGLAYRSKVDEDIEVIRKGHRFAVVWPSIHPDGGTYWWFGPGVKPDKIGRESWDGKIPNAKLFPILPDAWIDYLTNSRTKAVNDELIDVDSSVDEIYQWATDTFYGDDDTEPCQLMRQKLDKHLAKIATATSLHDLLVAGHWNILHLAFEGHLGWNQAINELEQAFVSRVQAGAGSTDRDVNTLVGEIFRSRVQALRQIKGKVDDRLAHGTRAVDPLCIKVGICGTGNVSSTGNVFGNVSGTANNLSVVDGDNNGNSDGDGSVDSGPPGELDDVTGIPKNPVDSYEMNDFGNAKHFIDYFSTLEYGPVVRWVDGYGWIVWHSGKNPHWERDAEGNQIVSRMWDVVRQHQLRYVEALVGQYSQDYDDEKQRNPGNFTASGNPLPGSALAVQRQKMQKWKDFVEKNGDVRRSENAIKRARSIYSSVNLKNTTIDSNRFLLGVANGVVELTDSIRLRPARPDDYITLNTNVEWKKPSDFAQSKWQEYLDTFIPDKEDQKAIQIAFGYCLIGGNPEKKLIVLKGDTNTGKSTMINAIQSALGDYAQSVNQSVFQNHKLNPVLAKALTKRVIVCSEFDEKDQLSASQVKKITGDTDVVQAELKGLNDLVEEVPQFVAILATNEVPPIKGADKALENRLHVFPFDVTPRRIDRKASNVLINACQPAILDWLIEGFKQYIELGHLPVTARMKEAKGQFVSELDEVATFVSECVLPQTSPQGYISRKAMYDHFERWWIENKFRASDQPSMPKFTRRMKALGYKTKDTRFRVNGALDHWWIGVRFNKPKSSRVASLSKVVSHLSETNLESETPKNSP